MKIKLLRDIPGFSKGWEGNTEMECNSNFEILRQSTVGGDTRYSVSYLINMGWAEEIKEDDIDIEEIRTRGLGDGGPDRYIKMSNEMYNWHKAYEIVKAVIEKLNGDWKPDWGDFSPQEKKVHILYSHDIKQWLSDATRWTNPSIIPYVKTHEIAKKVISLCEPELKVLFRVK